MNENELLKINIAHLARYHTNCIIVDVGSQFFLMQDSSEYLEVSYKYNHIPTFRTSASTMS